MQPAVMQQTNQLGMQAWGQVAVQQPQQGWDQQQVAFMAQQQWQPQQMQQWPVVQEQQQQQQQQWQAQVSQQTWQGQEQWQVQQQPAQPQQQWQQPPPQPKASGKGDWRELWRQQLQQQQQQQQWGQGMGMQQWGQGIGNQQPYGGMYNQQQYNYGQQQPQQGMMHQGAMFNQYGQQQHMQQQQPQQLPDMPPNPQQAWGGNMYQQQQGPMSQQGTYAAGPQHMQQQGPGAPSTQLLGTSAAVANSDYNMGGMGAPGLQQQSLPQPAAPARPPSPPKPLDLSQMLLAPGRDSRPKRLLLLLRGPPGCGKSHLARTIRQLEVSAGGQAPRLHSMDDYFMVDVEQDGDEVPGSKRRGSAAVTSQEYQYDAALEPSYWKSLLRAAGKTLGDRLHPLVLLDAPALRAEQVREVWKVVQGAGAELLVVNPLTTDPEVRNAMQLELRGSGLCLSTAPAGSKA
jgi:YLP motif-containing protein 1